MERRQLIPKTRKVVIVLTVSVIIILLLLLTSYLLVHSYINKINLVSTVENTGLNITAEAEVVPKDLEIEQEEIEPFEDTDLDVTDSDLPDSPVNEIATIEDDIRNNLEENSIPILYDKNVFNILLIGSDTRRSGGAGRSDAMILVSINKKTKKIIVTSILRDIFLQIPGKKNSNRINAAYAFGGADLLMETIEQNFRIQLDQYVSVDFYAFIDIVDAVEGVTVEVSEKEIPVINDYVMELNRLTGQEETKDCLTEPGILLLSGKQALSYARNRYVGNSDFERTARQRRVLEQIFKKVKSSDLADITDLLNIILPQVTTNLSEGEIFSLILSLPSYIDYDIEQWSIPMTGTYTSKRIRGMAVLGIDFNENIDELHNKVYDENLE
jgi:LCP family protein required for cell wall assembly